MIIICIDNKDKICFLVLNEPKRFMHGIYCMIKQFTVLWVVNSRNAICIIQEHYRELKISDFMFYQFANL